MDYFTWLGVLTAAILALKHLAPELISTYYDTRALIADRRAQRRMTLSEQQAWRAFLDTSPAGFGAFRPTTTSEDAK